MKKKASLSIYPAAYRYTDRSVDKPLDLHQWKSGKYYLAGLLIFFLSAGYSQTLAETGAIMIPLDALFEGMRTGDSALVHSAFAKEVTFVSILKGKNGKPVLRSEPLSGFLKSVGTKHADVYNEPIWDVAIQVDGDFAQVWAKYAFYLGRRFTHCGVDTFHLIKGEDGTWKIFHLADTRRTEGCDVPEKVSSQFK